MEDTAAESTTPAEYEPAPIDAQQAEVDTEQEHEDGSATVTLRTKEIIEEETDDKPAVTREREVSILVPPVLDWDAEGLDALEERRYTKWAKLVLAPKYWARWDNARPTLREADAFFKAWSDLSGQSSGKSGRSSRALRRAARR